MTRLLLQRLQRLETRHKHRTGSNQSRAELEEARDFVARILEAFPPPDLPRESLVTRLAAAIATHVELRRAFKRRADRCAFSAKMLDKHRETHVERPLETR